MLQERRERYRFTAPNLAAEVLSRLEQNTGYLAIAAAIRDKAGDWREALRLLRQAQAAYELQRQPLPQDLGVELAWTLLHAGDNEAELYTLLQNLGTRRDLTTSARHSLNGK